MNRTKHSTLVVLALLCASATALSGQETEDPARPSEDASYAARVSEIFSGACVNCHGRNRPAAGLSLEDDVFVDELVGVASLVSPEYDLVVPGVPDSSYLVMKVTDDDRIVGSRMPIAGAPLSEEEISAIEVWVAQLAAADTAAAEADTSAAAPDTTGAVPDTTGAKQDTPAPEPDSDGDGRRPGGGQPSAGERASNPVPGSSPAAFAATRLINLPTTLPIGDKELLFRVSHRFLPPVTSDYDPYWYGLNGPANVFLGLGYGITDNVSVMIGHSNVFHEYELTAVWIPLPGDGSSDLPLSAGITAGAGLMSQTQQGEDVFRSENMRLSVQVPMGWQLHERVSLLAVPGYASNTNHWEGDSEGTFSVGIGSRVVVAGGLALTGEWTTVVDGYETGDDNFGICVEYEIGGHVFQVLAMNGTGLTTGQYAPGAVQDFDSNDLRLGFNIFRTFWL